MGFFTGVRFNISTKDIMFAMLSIAMDKSLISFIAGPVIGGLVMLGAIDQKDAQVALQGAEIWVGAFVFLGGLLIGAMHHIGLTKVNNTDYSHTTVSVNPTDTPVNVTMPVSSNSQPSVTATNPIA